MILRKPYAFLIKYFKLVHLILTILSIYILSVFGDIYRFFNEYVKNNYSADITDNLAEQYITGYVYIFAVIIILLLIVLIFLLASKNKKQKLYTASLLMYITALGLIIYYASIFNEMESSLIAAEASRIYRDIIFIAYVFQYIFIGFFIIRTLGFNVKQFNFNSDIKELDLSIEDNEEVEINLNLDTNKIKKSGRKYVREFKYYLRENIFIIAAILLIVGGYLTYNIITNSQTFNNNIYTEKELFYQDNISIQVEESFITNYNQSGEEIKKDTTFLVVVITLGNNTKENINFDPNELKLVTNNASYNPSLSYSNYFRDYGDDLINNALPKSSNITYVIPYIVDHEEIETDFELSIYNGAITKNENSISTYNIVSLDPYTISASVLVSTYQLGQTIDFKETIVQNSSLTISDFEITDKYYYNDEICKEDDCTTFTQTVTLDLLSDNDKTMLVLDGTIVLDDETSYYLNNPNITDFVDNYLYIEYNYNGDLKKEKVEGFNGVELEDTLFIKIPKEARNSQELNLIITIRNMEYKYSLK